MKQGVNDYVNWMCKVFVSSKIFYTFAANILRLRVCNYHGSMKCTFPLCLTPKKSVMSIYI
jgi:hypothetical protein